MTQEERNAQLEMISEKYGLEKINIVGAFAVDHQRTAHGLSFEEIAERSADLSMMISVACTLNHICKPALLAFHLSSIMQILIEMEEAENACKN